MPNRHEESHGTMYEGHLVASETYVGGHVEALEAGVFRSDIVTHFKIEPSAVQQVCLYCILWHCRPKQGFLSSLTNWMPRLRSVSWTSRNPHSRPSRTTTK